MFNPQQYQSQALATLEHDVTFHIMHVHDISRLRLQQLDEWRDLGDPNHSSVDRLRDARVIREVNVDDDVPGEQPAQTRYKLTLRDQANNYCFAYEFSDPVPWLHPRSHPGPFPIPLGSKLLVKKGTLIEHGVIMLVGQLCQFLGPDIDMGDVTKKYTDMLLNELSHGGNTMAN